MSFLENLYKQLSDGKISNKESLEQEMHYYSLTEEEKKKMDLKYDSETNIVGSSQEYLEQNKSTSKSNIKEIDNKKGDEKEVIINEGTGTNSPSNDKDQSLVSMRLLKQSFSYNSNNSYKLLIKELLIRLIPISILILIISVGSDIPADNVPGIVTSFISIAGALVIFYSVASILGFLKVILTKVFNIKLKKKNKSKNLE